MATRPRNCAGNRRLPTVVPEVPVQDGFRTASTSHLPFPDLAMTTLLRETAWLLTN